MTVFSGDGDLSGIGGNHLIHAARRNMDLLVVLVNNFIYGMTGGQNAPTTPQTARSSTMPYGNFERPFNLPHLVASCGANYVARWTCLHIRRLTAPSRKRSQRKGFRFIEVIAPCSTLYSRLNKLGTGSRPDPLLPRQRGDPSRRRHARRGHRLPGQDRLRPKFVDEDRPTFSEMMDAHYKKTLGDTLLCPWPRRGGGSVSRTEIRITGFGGQGVILCRLTSSAAPARWKPGSTRR